jgi:hypothetical protein
MDPTTAELAGITNLDQARAWAGVSDELWGDFQNTTGAITLVRELAMLLPGEYVASMDEMEVTLTSALTRTLKAAERGRFRSLRRVCLILVGLPADEVSSLPSSSSANPAIVFPPTPGIPQHIVSTESVMIRDIIDQVTKIPITLLGSVEIMKMYTLYRKRFGANPNVDSAPTDWQISGLKQVVDSGQAPSVDFGIFGPHGKRLMRKLMFSAYRLSEDQQWIKCELSGPPDFDQWSRCYRTWKIAMLLIEAATVESLESYFELIKELFLEFGREYWWILYQADVRMRGENFDTMRRNLEMANNEWAVIDPRISSILAPFDMTMPWDAVIRTAAEPHHDHWTREVRNKIMTFRLTSGRQTEVLATDTSAQPRTSGGRDKDTPPWMRGNVKPELTSPAAKARKTRPNTCPKFNGAGCCEVASDCPEQLHHKCSHCNNKGHGAATCWKLSPHLKPAGKGSKGKSKGKTAKT